MSCPLANLIYTEVSHRIHVLLPLCSGAEAGGGDGADVSLTVEAQNNPVRAAISSTPIVESTYRCDVQDGIDFRVKLKADGPTGWRADAKTLMNLKCNVGSAAKFRKLHVLRVLLCSGNRAVFEVDRAEYDLKSKVLRTKGLPGMVGKTTVNISASFMDAAARAGVRRAHCSGLFMSFTRLLQDPVTMTMGLRYLVLLWRVLKQVTMRVPTSRTLVTIARQVAVAVVLAVVVEVAVAVAMRAMASPVMVTVSVTAFCLFVFF